MPTLTTNFSLNKPLVNSATDEDLWGGYLNDNMDSLDSLVKVARDSVKRNITTTDSVVAGDRNKILLCSASGGAFTLTLLAAATAGDGFKIIVKKTDSGGNAVTIDGNGSETIDGSATYSLSGYNDSVLLVSDGSNWHIASRSISSSGVSSASTSSEGIVELATDAEAVAGVDTSRAITAAGLAAALAAATFDTLPEITTGNTGKAIFGDVTVQWGTGSYASTGTITFGTAFSGTPYGVLVTSLRTASGVDALKAGDITTTNFVVTSSSAVAATCFYVAFGPT